MSDVVSVERVIPAKPEEIWALIADPTRHQEIDGSGAVRDAKQGPGQKLALGTTFGMNMKVGAPYSMKNTVIEYDENKVLAWQTKVPVSVLEKLAGGRIWKYVLEPVDGGTKVTESRDVSQEGVLTKNLVRKQNGITAKNMAATLERIEEVLTKRASTA